LLTKDFYAPYFKLSSIGSVIIRRLIPAPAENFSANSLPAKLLLSAH